MKKFLSLILSLLILGSTATVYAGKNTTFDDVDGDEYYADATETLADLNILTGYEDGTFRPSNGVTRAEMATVIVRMLGLEKEAAKSMGETNFSDVEDGHWASGYINLAVKEGIINGDGNGKFRPSDRVKHEEALKMLVCANGLGDDIRSSGSDWSKPYIEIADRNGLSDNLEGKKGETSTRGDVAVMVYNGLKLDITAPVASLRSGTYTGTQKVTLSTETQNAEIYYTTDGKDPAENGIKYESPISVTKTSTLKAITIKHGEFASDVTEVKYTISNAIPGGGGTSVSKYSVTFKLNYDGADNDDAPAKQTVKKGKLATEPDEPERRGYNFIGWSATKSGDSIFDFSTAIKKNTTLYAVWEEIVIETVDITFNLNYECDDNIYTVQQINKGGNAINPGEPERDGYTFEGWSVSADSAEIFDFAQTIDNCLTLFAIWAENIPEEEEEEEEEEEDLCTVEFNLNYSGAPEAPEAQTVAENEKITVPEIDERDGYAFLGWTRTRNGNDFFNFNTRINESFTLYAKWIERCEDTVVSLDDAEREIEIYSFDADTTDILLGETKNVTFTSEIFTQNELSATDVSVVTEDGTLVGHMTDNGTNGDETANDGIFTLVNEFTAEQTGNQLYYVKCGNEKSDSINIGYYREYTETDFAAVENVTSTFNEIITDDEDQYDNSENVAEAIAAKAEELKANGEITEYSVSTEAVRMTLKNGIPVVYMIPSEDTYAGNSTSGNVITFEPYRGTLNETLNADMDKASDGSAQLIQDRTEKYRFTGNYDLSNVTFENIEKIVNSGVVIWIGHGGYDRKHGSSLGTGEEVTEESMEEYSNLIHNGSLEIWSGVNGHHFAITGGYVKHYLRDLDNSLIYLIACHSGRDMIDDINNKYELAHEFIKNGASAVVGTSESVRCDYAHKFSIALFDRLTTKKNGEFYTLKESLDYAKSKIGARDGGGTEFMILPLNSREAENYRLEEKAENGIIKGSVKDSASGSPIANALIRIYKDGIATAETRTGTNGMYEIELPAGNYIMQVSAGHYKSTKTGVDLEEGETENVEVLLMIDVTLEEGIARGTVTHAVTGAPVAGVTLKFRRSIGNIHGNVIITSETDSNGNYSITADPGHYTVEASKDGFITTYRTVIAASGNSAANQSFSITPTLTSDTSFRVTLIWKDRPNDLDSHLTGPVADNTSRFHLYYPLKGLDGPHSNIYNLDLDNVNIVARPTVFETTTVLQPTDGVYRFSVHDFSNSGRATSTVMAHSNAKVTLYYGNSDIPVAEYHVPTDAIGTIWTVFEIDVVNGQLSAPRRIDRISSGNAHEASLYSEESVCEYDDELIESSIVEK